MNGIKGKLWAKLTAMFLFTISVAVFAVSLLAILFFVQNDTFFDGGKSALESTMRSSLNNKLRDVCLEISAFRLSIDEKDAYLIADHDPYLDLIAEKTEGYYPDDITVINNKDFKNFAEVFDAEYSVDKTNFYFEIYNSLGEKLYSNASVTDCSFRGERTANILKAVSAEKIFLCFDSEEEMNSYIKMLGESGYLINSSISSGYMNIKELEESGYLMIFSKSYNEVDEFEPVYCTLEGIYVRTEQCAVTVHGYIPDELSIKDDIYIRDRKVNVLVNSRYLFILSAFLSALMAIVSFIFVVSSAGYSSNYPGLHLTLFDKCPLEVYFGVVVLIAAVIISILEEIIYQNTPYWVLLTVFVILAAIASALFIILTLTVSARCKAGKIFHYTIIFGSMILMWKLIVYLFSNLKFIWKTLICLGVAAIYDLMCVAMALSGIPDGGVSFFILGKIVECAIIVIYAVGIGRIQKSCNKLSSGEINAEINKSMLPSQLKSIANDIGSIEVGIRKAVEEQTKSERLKTELITNVSHDLKTPLTSIVNYVDILSKEDIKPDSAKEYVDILVRQSQRMKKLIDDLVEASKASSGAININYEPIDMSLLITQVITEYEEKLSRSKLTPVLNIPESSATVMIDGKLMWRVLDNIVGNACKYAQPDTRFYISEAITDDRVTVTFKNISKYALNISGDELMERFVRGDSSRHTEGSGLGLSIAKSLCELQNVDFDIKIDGDLFKAVLSMNKIEDIPEKSNKTEE